MSKEDYKNWSHEGLIQRVEQLERELKEKNASAAQQILTSSAEAKVQKKVKKAPSTFDPSKYSTRLIALKLSYLGKDFNGFEHHLNNTTPLPTIEEELWAALMKACLIFPKAPDPQPDGEKKVGVEINWEGCEYSKCGRTDKGVSAFGQVIGIRVRSNRPLGKPKSGKKEDNTQLPEELETRALPLSPDSITETTGRSASPTSFDEDEDTDYSDALDFDHIKDEIPYAAILNKILPPTIRILAWCPSPPLDFSARFSCQERQYRYFFTQPAFAPSPLPAHPISSQIPSPPPVNTGRNKVPDGWLDIEAMRKAAKHYEGVHDFRNFCKLDGGKQIENFEREIFKADIEEVDPRSMGAGYAFSDHFLPPSMEPQSSNENEIISNRYAKVYTFTLHGSAFLWHQVRHMVAILFFVGQGLEDPSIIPTLLDISKTPARPAYEMASDVPLVLWDCVFSKKNDPEGKEALGWLYVGDETPDTKFFGNGALMDDLWRVWRERKIDEILAGSLMNLVSKQGNPLLSIDDAPKNNENGGKKASKVSQKVFDGGDTPRWMGRYVPVEKKPKLDRPEVVNERFARKKGFESSKEMRQAKSGVRKVGLGVGGEVLDDGNV